MDRIGDSAKKGLDFIKSRARETVEVQKLSSELKQLEDRRERCLTDIGHRVMAAYGSDDMCDETFRDRVEEVHYLTDQIKQVSAEHESTKDNLRQSVGGLMPKRNAPPIPPPEYD